MALPALVVGGLLAPAAHPTTVEAKHTEPAAADPWNSRLSVDVGSDGRYSVGAFPDPSTGDPTTGSFKLLYGWPNTGTTYSTLRIDGADAILGQEAPVTAGPTDSGDTDTTTFADGAVTTTQTLSLVTNPQTGQADAVRIAYKVSNGDATSHNIGVRAMLDTDVNDNDGAPYRVPGIGAVTTEQDLSGSAIPDTFQVFQDLSDTSHIASATLRGADATPPDRLVVAAWPSIYGAPWNYTTTAGQPITNDSAYATYWNPQSLAAGSSRTYVTYYGLANVTVDLTPPIALGLTGPASLAIAGTSYSPNPFSVVATVSDDGTAPVDGATIALNLQAGLHTSDPTTVNLGTLNPGDPEQLVTWHVTADPQASATTLTYSVTANGSNTGSKTLSRQIAVPALAPTAGRYVALGDSYSSGEGSYDYYPDSNDPGTFDTCHRSPHAYGPLLAADKHFGTPAFAACSGAVTEDMFSNNHDNPNESPQLSRLGPDTRTVTLTLGGNDAAFPHVITKCVDGFRPPGTGPEDQGSFGCSRNKSLRRDIDARLSALNGQPTDALLVGPPIHALSEVYKQIHQKAPNAKIFVGGYPWLFGTGEKNYQKNSSAPSGSSCLVGVTHFLVFPVSYRVDYLDALWIDQMGNRLNGVIQNQVNAARSAGVPVTYVPVPYFRTHGLCDRADSWINGIKFTSKPSVAAESFHPTVTGQRLGYERSFLSYVS